MSKKSKRKTNVKSSVLVLLLTVCFGTFAIYRNSKTGTGTVKAANWSVQIAGSDISSANFEYNSEVS